MGAVTLAQFSFRLWTRRVKGNLFAVIFFTALKFNAFLYTSGLALRGIFTRLPHYLTLQARVIFTRTTFLKYYRNSMSVLDFRSVTLFGTILDYINWRNTKDSTFYQNMELLLRLNYRLSCKVTR